MTWPTTGQGQEAAWSGSVKRARLGGFLTHASLSSGQPQLMPTGRIGAAKSGNQSTE